MAWWQNVRKWSQRTHSWFWFHKYIHVLLV